MSQTAMNQFTIHCMIRFYAQKYPYENPQPSSVKCPTVTQSVDLDLIIREVDMTGGFMYTTKPLEAAYISGDRGGGGEARVSRLIVDGGSGFPLDLENLEK